jgi:hypothetical protein
MVDGEEDEEIEEEDDDPGEKDRQMWEGDDQAYGVAK